MNISPFLAIKFSPVTCRKYMLVAVLMSSVTHMVYAQPEGPRSEMESENEAVAQVLDDFHRAASEADSDRYFGHFATHGIFLGTDATERWTVESFKGYAKPYFDQGRGWTYTATERHVYLSDDGLTACFDERLANESFGECRGSGVLVMDDGRWKIAQYNLTIPVPNDLAYDLVEMIRALDQD